MTKNLKLERDSDGQDKTRFDKDIRQERLDENKITRTGEWERRIGM